MNACYTYFSIRGEFDPVQVTELLGLQPFESRKEGENRAGGNGVYSCSVWNFGKCDEYDVDVNEQIRKSIAPLRDKLAELSHIKDNFVANFYIEVVPELCVGEPAPILGADMDIIDFCHVARAEIDVDLYLYEADESRNNE